MFIKKIIFALFILTVFFNAAASVRAQTIDPSPTPIPYELSYPGLLPDNPLYFLKVFRDNMQEFFIGRQVDKANFALLQSDKDVSAARILIKEKNNMQLAQKIYAISQREFAKALTYTTAAKKEGMDIHDLAKKLQLASKKHDEVLQTLKKELPAEERKQFMSEQKESERLIKQAAAIKP